MPVLALPMPIPPSSEREAEQSRRQRLAADLALQHVPEEFRGKTWADFDPKPDRDALRKTQAWVDAVGEWFRQGKPRGGPSLFLTSSRPGELVAPGNGKSLLMGCAMTALAGSGFASSYTFEGGERMGETWPNLAWVSSADLIDQIRGTYGTSRSAEDVLARYLWADVLILDDVGTEPGGEDATAKLFRLIDRRQHLVNGWTSNYSPDALARRSPEWAKIVSRMRGTMLGGLLKGPDRRPKSDPWGRFAKPAPRTAA